MQTILARAELLALLMVALSGCFHFPLGMNEAQWVALTPEQQREARFQQTQRNKDFDLMSEQEELRFDDAYSVE